MDRTQELLAKYGGAPTSSPPPAMGNGHGMDERTKELMDKYAPPPLPEQKGLFSDEPMSVLGVNVGSPRGLVKTGLDWLPTAGGVAGGVAGAAGGLGIGSLPGAMGGAAAGGATGEALKNLGEKYLLGESKDANQIFTSPVKEGLFQAAGEGAGQLISKGLGAAGKGLLSRFEYAPKENASQIAKAAENLGAKATPGMLSESKGVQALEDTLERGPTISSGKAQKDKLDVYKAMTDAAENLTGDRSYMSSHVLGDEIKNGITQKIAERLQPLQMSYRELEDSTKFVPLNPKSITNISNGLRMNPLAEFPDSPAGKIFNGFADKIGIAKSADSLRTLEKSAQSGLRSTLIPEERAAYGKVIDTLKRAQQGQIIRASIDQAPTVSQGKKIGSEIVQQLKDTNKGYRALMETIEEINPGIKSKGANGFLEALDDIPNEKIADKLFKTNDFKKLSAIKENLPNEFEMMRSRWLDDIANKSSVKGNLQANMLLKNVQSLTPEARNIIFGEKSGQVFNDLKTLSNAMPDKVNSSGTASGIQWSKFMSPTHWGQEASDAFKYMILKNSAKTPVPAGATEGLIKTGVQVGSPGLIKSKQER